MFAHITTQRQLPRTNAMSRQANSHQQAIYQGTHTHLRIAVAIALSCTAIQVQAADESQTYNELPVPETAFEYEDYDTSLGVDETSIDSNGTATNRKVISKEFVAQQAKFFAECTQVQSSAARLACFDKVAEQGKTPSYTSTKQPVDLAKTFQSTISGNPKVILAEAETTMSGTTVEDADTILVTNQQFAESKLKADSSVEVSTETKSEAQILESVGVTQTDIEKYSPLSLSYDLDKNSERGTWTVRPYRPTYLLPLFYTLDPNLNPGTPTQITDPLDSNDIRETELKFQLSLKTKVAEDLFDTNADLWFGYTQESHWQVYNEDNSRPFRATDYQPEIFLTQPVTASLPFGGRLRMLGAGAVHQSNGQDDPLSRSWNRAYLMAGAEWGRLSVIPRIWTRVNNENSSDDDNPDIEDYMGYGDIKFLYDLPNENSISGTLRYNPSTNKGAAQIDYIYPLSENVKGMVQLFQGYGESIVDYNHESTSIGFGIVLNDWKGL
ncbi:MULTISPECIES: phospholipase A [unclassified Psychrobacter]|uniref:phospholipase A n=1 Tax=unclassified Psychrobacter TaxID=196806 RepID=UPI0025B60402|nr:MULTISPECIES: phospholipase A [unclassified Psychrobacter]MDN3454621.1 phospholipase A [Psychrobacter sp. APC 3350]MDN3501398.1 phospholipase A [Psychrobacter sp. 5A.1]